MLAETIATVGLALDIVGVTLLFLLGLPARVTRDVLAHTPFTPSDDGNLIADGGDERAEIPIKEQEKRQHEETKKVRDRRISKWGQSSGFFALVLGFLLQICAQWM